ncbi:MAG: hypothetical protein FD138_4001 [Planctomycetota bacterium]|nr:MAG: hypothetical protein FD138_4001 [Planctomycetota bacterium]
MSRCVSGATTKIEHRPLSTDKKCESLKQLTIERLVIQLVEEFLRVGLAGNVVSNSD